MLPLLRTEVSFATRPHAHKKFRRFRRRTGCIRAMLSRCTRCDMRHCSQPQLTQQSLEQQLAITSTALVVYSHSSSAQHSALGVSCAAVQIDRAVLHCVQHSCCRYVICPAFSLDRASSFTVIRFRILFHVLMWLIASNYRDISKRHGGYT